MRKVYVGYNVGALQTENWYKSINLSKDKYSVNLPLRILEQSLDLLFIHISGAWSGFRVPSKASPERDRAGQAPSLRVR